MRTFVIGIVLASLSLSAAQPRPAKVALLVGVNQYDKRALAERPLDYAERDVLELKEVLEGQGFTVRVLTGSGRGNDRATKANIERALDDVLGPGRNARDIVLLGFSGHGTQLPLTDERGRPIRDGRGIALEDAFYCPVDGVPSVPSTLISLTRTVEELDRKGGINLMLVDACRDRPTDPGKGRTISGDELNGRLPRNTAILFGCAANQQSFETPRADGGHGIFFYHVLEALRGEAANRRGLVTWGALVNYVRENVDFQAQEWLPDQSVGRDGTLQTPHALTNLIAVPVLARVSTFEGTEAGNEWSDNGLKMAFRWCPAGAFLMGSPEDERLRGSGELQHRVGLTRGFWLGQYEVTQSEYESVMGTNPSYFSSSSKGSSQVADQDTSVFPVESVSWEDAVAFCRKLTEQDRRTGTLPLGWEYRLPTEAQWEYACRAGTTTATLFGSSLSSRQANFDGNYPYNGASNGPYLKRPTRVGSYGPNAWGLHDLHGNVWEWCRDWYASDYYAESPDSDPQGSPKASVRVIRGGSWSVDPRYCRAAFRDCRTPEYRNFFLGFRPVAVPSGG